jgi:small conductance mechanosensitive channel
MIRTCEILFVTLLLFVGLEVFKKKFIKADTHFQTALRLIISFTRYALFIIAIIWILSSWGVDTQALLVSAGILGLIIGLGAQSLIADIIAGMFIVFDGEYKVGDFIVVDGWRGMVMEIGIRTTKIKDEGGNIKYINNNTIKAVVNQSQDLSVVKTELCIFYDENLENVELKIKEYLPKIKDKIPYIVEGPYYKGVQGMEDSYVTLLFLAKCEEVNFYPAKRALNREIYRMANEMNIPIPYPQIVVNQPMPEGTFAESKTVFREKVEATAFAYDQAYDSEGMEAENTN